MGDCNTLDLKLPMNVRVAGVPPTDRLLQSPDFPQGEASGSPWQLAAAWEGPVPGCPGDKVEIGGHVRSLIVEQPVDLPNVLAPIVIDDASEEQFSALPVKLRMTRCRFGGWTIIDSDCSLVFDAGENIRVEAMMPASWFIIPSTVVIGEVALYQYVTLAVRVCPLKCCTLPSANLSYFATLTDETGVVVRPRRARALQIFGPPGTGGSQWRWWNGDPAGGGNPLGEFTVNGGFVSAIIMPGAASHLQLITGGGLGAAFYFVWSVD